MSAIRRITGNGNVKPLSDVVVVQASGAQPLVITKKCAFEKQWGDHVEYLSLEPITVTAWCTRETPVGFVSINGKLQAKVDMNNDKTKEGRNVKQNMLAWQHFLGKIGFFPGLSRSRVEGKGPRIIHQVLTRMLLANQYKSLNTDTGRTPGGFLPPQNSHFSPPKLLEDREALSQLVGESIRHDLENIGFALVSYKVIQVTCSRRNTFPPKWMMGGEGFLTKNFQSWIIGKSGRKDRPLFVLESKNVRLHFLGASDIRKTLSRQTRYRKLPVYPARPSGVVRLALEEKKASADKGLQVKKAMNKEVVSTAKKKAAVRKTKTKAAERKAKNKAAECKAEAHAVVPFDAEKAIQGQQARTQEIKHIGEAVAHKIKELSQAEAATIIAKGEAEAKERAQEIQHIGNAAAQKIKELRRLEAEVIIAKGEAEAKARAQATKLIDEARADEIRVLGQAEAAAIIAKGEAEAKVIEQGINLLREARAHKIKVLGEAEAAAIIGKDEAKAKARAQDINGINKGRAHAVNKHRQAEAAEIIAKGEAEAKEIAQEIQHIGKVAAQKIKNLRRLEADVIIAKGEAKAKARAKITKLTHGDRAEKIKELGQAEAAAIIAKGEAEAQVVERRGDSFEHFVTAAVVQSIVDSLPDTAREVSSLLAKTEKMAFVSGEQGGATSRLTVDLGNILDQLPATVEAATRAGITKGLERFVEGCQDLKTAVVDSALAAAPLAGNKNHAKAKGRRKQ